MFKSKSSRLARQQQEEAEAVRLAALPKQDYLDNCHRTYSCIHCRAHLANHDELISKLFQGNQGRAYLFNRVVNIGCRRAITRELLTGLHAVCDIYCKTCETTLGWKYETAFVASQKYKEGKFIIELVHMIKENNSDPSSFARTEQLFRGVSRQQVPAYEQVYLSPGGPKEFSSSSSSSVADDWAPRAPSAAGQQPTARQRNAGTGRDRSSSSVSILYRNGPPLAGAAPRLRAPSTPAAAPAATCASREHVAAGTTNHAAENRENSGENDGPTPASAKTSDSNGRAIHVVVGLKEILAHRNHQSISSSPALNSLAPTGGGGLAARGSSEGSSQLSSSSDSLAVEAAAAAGDK